MQVLMTWQRYMEVQLIFQLTMNDGIASNLTMIDERATAMNHGSDRHLTMMDESAHNLILIDKRTSHLIMKIKVCLTFFTSEQPKRYKLWSCQKMCDALHYLLDNIYWTTLLTQKQTEP